MTFQEKIKIAYNESVNGQRFGDKEEELEAIKEYVLSSKKILIPTTNQTKINVINEVLNSFNLPQAETISLPTYCADLTRMPAISKAIMALDLHDCDLIIARGRLGVPGSGSMMVLMDNKGRVLSAALSKSHVVHRKKLEDAVTDEIIHLLDRIGLGG
jgi:hypothetical protein